MQNKKFYDPKISGPRTSFFIQCDVNFPQAIFVKFYNFNVSVNFAYPSSYSGDTQVKFMAKQHILRLHWKLFIPLVTLLWLIIGITIIYFVAHEKQRQKENLENRLLNVNNTVIDAYERGVDLQKTVDFIRHFTDNTTLAPLRITVYDSIGNMVADNPEVTIPIYDKDGKINPDYKNLLRSNSLPEVQDVEHNDVKSMISSRKSPDGKIYSLAALPYEGEVLDFLSIDPMVWILVIVLGVFSSVLAFFGVRAVCRNVYALRDFAQAVSTDNLPDDIDSLGFSKDELGDVSKNLLRLYRDKMHAEQEKMHHERQIMINISHELNTPAGIVKGYLDTVLETDDMPDDLKRKFLERAQQDAKRLTTLINNVSTVMCLQESGNRVEVEPIDIHALTLELAGDISKGHIADGMEFRHSIPEHCLALGPRSLLMNALLNLVYNAARYSHGSYMSLQWEGIEDGAHIFTFSDDGVGVDGEHIDRLFDLFYRVDFGRSRKNGGFGLGLPLVRRIFDAMRGTIAVENATDGGLRYTFTLPVAPIE